MDGVFLVSWGCLLMRTLASLLGCGECGRGVPRCFPTDTELWLVLVLVLGLLMTLALGMLTQLVYGLHSLPLCTHSTSEGMRCCEFGFSDVGCSCMPTSVCRPCPGMY